MTAPVCFVDTETDGVHPGRLVWEAALIRRENGDPRTDVELSFFVQLDLSTADPYGLRVGRFYDRHPLGCWIAGAEGRRPGVWTDVTVAGEVTSGVYVSAEVAAHVVARVTHGAHLVGAVPNFDAEVLSSLLRAYGLTPAWHYHLVDVEALAVGYLQGKGAEFVGRDGLRGGYALPWVSEDLSRWCGVEPPSEEERHTALGDARWARRLYDTVTAG